MSVKAPVVMDSSAMIAIALVESRGASVLQIIRANPGSCFIHSVNAYEVASRLMEEGVGFNEAWEASLFGGVLMVDEIPLDMSRRAVLLKNNNRHLSLGDCHCLAFAEGMGGSLLTTDERLAEASTIITAIHLK